MLDIFYYKWSSTQYQINLSKYLQKAQGQVKKHSLFWLSVFTFYEPFLREEIILEGFFKAHFLVVLTFIVKTTLLIYQKESQSNTGPFCLVNLE